jgi:hypothetical protein
MSTDQQIAQDDEVFTVAPPALKALQEMMPAINLRCGYFAMGDPDDPETPGVVMLEMNPGRVLERHAHDCERFETVVRGSLHVGDKVLHAGDTMTAAPNEFYGPHTAGPDGVLTAEVFGSFQSATRPIFLLPDGTSRKFDYVAGDIPPEDVLELARENAPVVEV